MKTVWLIGYGGYEETILGVYTTERLAKKAKRQFCKDNDISEDNPDLRIFEMAVNGKTPVWERPAPPKDSFLDVVARECYPVDAKFWEYVDERGCAYDMIMGTWFRRMKKK